MPGVAAGIFGPLSEANINVDMIVQNVAADGELTDMTFTVGKADFERALQVLEGVRTSVGFRNLITSQNVVKISVIGVGLSANAGVAQVMIRPLAGKGNNIQETKSVREGKSGAVKDN